LRWLSSFFFKQRIHPERPERIIRIINTLKEKNLYQRCKVLNSRYAIDQELELCHKKNYIEYLRKLKSKSKNELIEMTNNPDSVYFHWETFECALLATGCLLSVVDEVCSKKVFCEFIHS
jgi:acetoin utilization deacetylase AcuC-like enzyme